MCVSFQRLIALRLHEHKVNAPDREKVSPPSPELNVFNTKAIAIRGAALKIPACIGDQRQTIDDAVIDEFQVIKAHYESMGSIAVNVMMNSVDCERYIIFRALLTQKAQKSIPKPPVGDVDEAFAKLKEEHGGEEQFYASVGLKFGAGRFDPKGS